MSLAQSVPVQTQFERAAIRGDVIPEMPTSLPAATGRVGRRDDGFYEVHHLTLAAFMVRARVFPDRIRRIVTYRTKDGRFYIILSNPNPQDPQAGFAVMERLRMSYVGSEAQQIDAEVAASKQTAVTIKTVGGA